jgi:hypothetical protein
MLLGFLLRLSLVSIGYLALLVGNTSQADQTKQNNNTDLTLGGSWVSRTAPGWRRQRDLGRHRCG